MKVVLDTNVLLSGLMFPDGAPGRVVAAWREARFELVVSVHQLAEIGRALAYPKIRRILDWDERRIEQWLERIKGVRVHRAGLLHKRLLKRDPKEHHEIIEFKVFTFEGQIARARTEIEWAKTGLRLIDKLEQEWKRGLHKSPLRKKAAARATPARAAPSKRRPARSPRA